MKVLEHNVEITMIGSIKSYDPYFLKVTVLDYKNYQIRDGTFSSNYKTELESIKQNKVVDIAHLSWSKFKFNS